MSDNRPSVYVDDDGTVVYRASSLGNCIRALAAARQGIEQAAFSDDTKVIFEEGNLHEEAVKKRLRSEGWTIADEQAEVELVVQEEGPRIVVRGHLDGDGVAMPEKRVSGLSILEVKSMSRSKFDEWIDNDFGANQWEGFEGYGWQISAYIIATGRPAYYVVKNRDNGQLDIRHLPGPWKSLKQIRDRVLEAEAWADGGFPECDLANPYFCNYWFLHDEDDTPQYDAADDDELNDLWIRWREQNKVKQQAEKAIKKLKEQVQAKVDIGETLTKDGRFVVTHVPETPVDAFTRRAYTKIEAKEQTKRQREMRG